MEQDKLNLYMNQFFKIKLINDISSQIALYGEKCGIKNFSDYLDMSCGAIPEGSYEKVIDPEAAEVFLDLYYNIAESRLALSITKLLEINNEFLIPIKDFCFRIGQDYWNQEVKDIKQAFELIMAFILDGKLSMQPKEIIKYSENEIVWKISVDTHLDFWEKVKGNINNYYEIQQSIVSGLLSKSSYKYQIENNTIFTLKKE